MKNLFNGIIASIAFSLFNIGSVSAQAYTENFDNITTLPGSGWFSQNNSQPLGILSWFQGTNISAGGPFDAYNGAANAYLGVNFNSTTGGTGTISNWQVTPNRTLRNGDVFTFFTRNYGVGQIFPDRLEVRMSTNGASTNVGTLATDVGDFTTLLLSINPLLTTTGYPSSWTQYTITISGLPAPTSGRIAFRYYVTNGGPTGTNSDYIGIDNVTYTPYVCPAFTMTPGGALTGGAAGSAYSNSLTQTGALGAPSYAITSGALPPGLTLSASGTISGTPTATGTFNFTATVSDASGCSGSQSYSITIVCPSNPLSLNGLPALCDNAGAYTLVQGLPAGGTYSGTGVSGGMFDPMAGTQTITYDYTDPYGCAFSISNPITVNTSPTVTLASIAAVCDNGGMVTLSGESPAGGTFSGTGVSGGMFDPAAGTQTVTYTYTDANGCSNSDSQTLTVNVAPVVTQSAYAAVCDNSGMLALTGGSPAGGTYSGTGVTGSDFDPTSGTQTVTYTYTDANGCSNSADQSVTVNTAPVVTQSAYAAVCDNSGTLALSGGSPAGGTYSGTGVTGSDFDPTAGTQTVTYTYTDANGCSNSADQTVTVNTAPVVTQSAYAAVCDNSGTLALSGGSPAGGTYSGTGVTGSDFDPTAGTQTVTYTYTDANGCSNSADQTVTVNIAPVVTQSAYAAICDNSGMLALTGGSPAGGTYSGTGVSGSDFDPDAGSQMITYTYTDANGCSNSADQTVTVNTAPVVTLSAFTPVCEDASTITLTGGSPAGGTYSGTGVSGSDFDPAAGSQMITYTYTDANGCTNSANGTIDVNPLPTVALTLATDQLCVYNSAITLSGGTPAGGTYSGAGVSGGSFNPATAGLGTATVTYMYTDANGCMDMATDAILVDACLSISEETAATISVYPNPSSGLFEVSGLNANSTLKMVDAQGRVVDFAQKAISNTQITIDISTMPNGIYLLNVGNNVIRLVKN